MAARQIRNLPVCSPTEPGNRSRSPTTLRRSDSNTKNKQSSRPLLQQGRSRSSETQPQCLFYSCLFTMAQEDKTQGADQKVETAPTQAVGKHPADSVWYQCDLTMSGMTRAEVGRNLDSDYQPARLQKGKGNVAMATETTACFVWKAWLVSHGWRKSSRGAPACQAACDAAMCCCWLGSQPQRRPHACRLPTLTLNKGYRCI